MQPDVFSNRARYPGTDSSPFDALLRLDEWVQKIPLPLIAIALFGLALIPTRADLISTIALASFFCGDGLLIAILPRAGKSFGPVKPPLLLLALMRKFFAGIPSPWNWSAQIIGTLLVVYGFWIEPHRVRVTHQTLVSSKMKTTAPPLRVLHLGDLHVERVTGRENQVVELARTLKPDVILFSGDFLNLSNVDDPIAWEHVRAILRQLSAPGGVFAVTGSPPVDKLHVVERLLDGLDNIRWLRDERVSIEHHGQGVDLVGITCTHKPNIDGKNLNNILHGDPDDLTILLYHTPDLAPEAAAQGVDLQLSGHTHGGQVRLPFFGAVYTSSLYGKRFESGRHRVKDMTLYVTRGIGMEGKGAPRVRFLCPPEIILWEIAGK